MGTAAPEVEMAERTHTVSAPNVVEQQGTAMEQTWPCPRCTLVNSMQLQACNACGLRRIAPSTGPTASMTSWLGVAKPTPATATSSTTMNRNQSTSSTTRVEQPKPIVPMRQQVLPTSTTNLAAPLRLVSESMILPEESVVLGSKIDRDLASNWIYPSNYPIRTYQQTITRAALFHNTLVCLPTGLGKTLIAAVVIYNFYRWFPQGKIVFMAPTKPLVSQQIQACHDVMPIPQADMAKLQGNVPPARRKQLWAQKRVFFCTPQSLQNDIDRGNCEVSSFVCIVVDEAHRAVGNYAYVMVVKAIAAKISGFRVLALSATPGSKFDVIQEVISNLRISHIECKSGDDPDVKKYTHSRQEEIIKCKMNSEVTSVRTQFLKLFGPILHRLCTSQLFHVRDPDKINRWMIMQARERMRSGQQPPRYRTAEVDFALLISLLHGRDVLTIHGIGNFKTYLDSFMIDRVTGPKKALIDSPDFQALIPLVNAQVGGGKQNINNPKLVQLQSVLHEHFTRHNNGNSSTRAIVFTQYRESVAEIVALLSTMAPLIKVQPFIGQGTAKGKEKGQTQKQQQEIVAKFRNGEFNVLAATCIAEEGLDIGEVDLIVSFDCLTSPVRMIQRMGRTGRKRVGRVVLLVTEGDEEKKLKRSVDAAKSVNRSLTIFKDKFKFVAGPRMVPKDIHPQVLENQMVVPTFQASLIAGKKSKKPVIEEETWRLTEAERQTLEFKFNHQLSNSQNVKMTILPPARLNPKSKPHHFGKSQRSRYYLQLLHAISGRQLSDMEFDIRQDKASQPLPRVVNDVEEALWVSPSLPTVNLQSNNSYSIGSPNTNALEWTINSPELVVNSPEHREAAMDVIDIASSDDETPVLPDQHTKNARTPPRLAKSAGDSMTREEKPKGNPNLTLKPTEKIRMPTLSAQAPEKVMQQTEVKSSNLSTVSTSAITANRKKKTSDTKKSVDPSQKTIEKLFQQQTKVVGSEGTNKRKKLTTPIEEPSNIETKSNLKPLLKSPLDPSASILQQGAQVISWLEELSTAAAESQPSSPVQSIMQPPNVSPPAMATPSKSPLSKPLPRIFIDSPISSPIQVNQCNTDAVPPPPTTDAEVRSPAVKLPSNAPIITSPKPAQSRATPLQSTIRTPLCLPPRPTMTPTPTRRPVQRRINTASPIPQSATKSPLHIDLTSPQLSESKKSPHKLRTPAPNSQIIVYTPDKAPSQSTDEDCQVCGETYSFDCNPILFCDGCNIGVHQECYGVQEVPNGSWFCDFCSKVKKGTKPKCALCPIVKGAYKQTLCKQWVHLQCFLWIPELRVEPMGNTFRLGSLETLDSERFELKCEICKTTDGFGVIQCAHSTCLTAFHVSCGFHAQYTLGQSQAGEDTQFLMYCPTHTSSLQPVLSPSAVFATPEVAQKKSRKRLKQAADISRPKKRRLRANKHLMNQYMELDVGVDGDASSDEDEIDGQEELDNSFISYEEASQVVSPASMMAIYRRRSLSPNLGHYFRSNGIVASLLKESEANESSVQDTSVMDEEDDGTYHHGYSCDGCELNPIQGVRYSCQTCSSYDLCICCYSIRKDIHAENHTFLAIQQPVAPAQTQVSPVSTTAPSATIGLTAEQVDRMQESRRKALEIQRRRQQLSQLSNAQTNAPQQPSGATKSATLAPPPNTPAQAQITAQPKIQHSVQNATQSTVQNTAQLTTPINRLARPSSRPLGLLRLPQATVQPVPSSAMDAPVLSTTENQSIIEIDDDETPSFNLFSIPQVPKPKATFVYHLRLKNAAFIKACGQLDVVSVEDQRVECDLVLGLRIGVNVYAFEQLQRLFQQSTPNSQWITLSA
ncbi:DEAD/DEAH box RNA helicase, partial [Thraustotheca clavata]